MRREAASTYGDQYEYLADTFELIRLKSDAYTLRAEASETERMARYTDRHGRETERSHILEIYYDLERSIARREELIQGRKRDTERAGVRFPIDALIQAHSLSHEEVDILLILLYNEAAARNQARITTGNDILNLLFPNPVEALKASRFFTPGATLLGHGLVRCLSEDDGTNFLRASYEATEKTLREFFGGRTRPEMELGSTFADSLPEGPYRLINPRFKLDRVVLDPAARNSLEDVLWHVRDGRLLMEEWELGRLLEKGHGVVILFSGLPGTGKTMAAEAMAGELGRRLLIADYSQLESKWIGETEKNIVSVFRAADEARAVLLIDEADAILAARLDGSHYNDRAYNRQVSLLLQELEHFDGLCVLTTNREMSLDEGLARRIGTTVVFGVPGPGEREKIWRSLISPRVPLAGDVDFAALAVRFPLCGGHIKNVVVAALRSAARRGGDHASVTMSDFVQAAEREKKSFGRETRAIGFDRKQGLSFA